jgi:rhamnose transport system ATP-binding protein
MKPLLELAGISKAFGSVRALKHVSFSVRAGEVHALLGENGAGKSTLIKVITGAHTPDTGSVTLDGVEAGALSPARARALGIACIYQQPALFPDLTVAENIRLRLQRPKGLARARHDAQAAEAAALLDRIGAQIPAGKEVRELSMPEQQLVEIACAIGSGARIVVMDEPTASLTQTEQHLLFAVVRDLKARGVGVIYISHRLEEIFALADRVTVLRDGETVATHPIDELTEAQMIRLMVGREVSQIYPPAESTPAEIVLETRQLSCSVAGISGIDLQVRAGEVLGLAGLVGAGRTELARVLFGIHAADAGEILLRGKQVEIRSPGDAVQNGIAYVPEDRRQHGLILELPIAENITMASHPRCFGQGLLRAGRELEIANRFIGQLGIKAAGPGAPGGSLSGGNQQKVSLARWLATEPKLLILDEPTQGVDVGAKSEIHRIIRNLASEGLAVLMISSDLPEILGMSDRIAVMRGGRIVEVIGGAKADAHSVMSAALGQTRKEAA